MRCLPGTSSALAATCLMLAPLALRAGPGLLVRNAEKYYQAPIPRTVIPEERLPASPPETMLRPFQEEDLIELQDAGYLEDYQGPDWNRPTPCTRYQAAFLLGGFLEELTREHGDLLPVRRTGPRRLLLPRENWGRERVARVLALPLLEPGSSPWWDDSPDRFQVAGWLVGLLDRLERHWILLRDPRPYQVASRQGDLPVWGHPLRRRVQEVLETQVMVAPEGYFRGRERITAQELVRILVRLRTVVQGYRPQVATEARMDSGG